MCKVSQTNQIPAIQIHVLVFPCWRPHAGVPMLVFSCWCSHAGVLMLVFTCWCPHAGVLMLYVAPHNINSSDEY